MTHGNLPGRRWRVLIVGLASGAASVAAGGEAPESPRFTRLSVADGLSQSSVQQILQDRHGLLWFGTQEGLNRYDGYRFTVHRAREQDGFLRDHDITALIEDADGDLWVGTSRGLYQYDLDTGRFDICASPLDRLGVTDLAASADGRVFLAASDRRLWVIDRHDAARRPRPLHDGPYAPLNGITALAAAEGATVWVAAQGKLFKVDEAANAAAGRVVEALKDLGSVSVLARDRNGHVWIGRADAELLRYRPGDGGLDRFPQAPRATLAILPARGGAIWIGARAAGLSRLDPTTGDLVVYRHDPEEPSSLSSDDVAAIYEDAVGGLWIGSWNGGVDRFDPDAQAFRTFRRRPRTPDSLPASDVTAMTEAPDGSLWLASRGRLIMTGDPRTGRFRVATAFPGGARLTAIASWNDRILVGSDRGLAVLDRVSGRAAALDAGLRAHGLDQRAIAAIRASPDAVWIASDKDVFRVRRPSPREPARVEWLPLPVAGSVSSFSGLEDGRVWIGTDAGEVLTAEWRGADAPAAVRAVTLGEPARRSLEARGFISALQQDRGGQVWVGTRRGLGRLDPRAGTIAWLGEQEGLPSTNIAGIAADADGRLWIGHNRGLTRVDPASGVMTHFGEREGAQGKGYAEGAWAAGGSGLIYFAGDGVTAFDPRAVRISPHRPSVLFTALEVLHRPVPPAWLDPGSPLQRTIEVQEEVTLGPAATVFSVEMAPLHFVDPASNRLMYRLDGFDRDWIETGAHNRVATYTNLAPGRYVLRARAGTKNGVWSEREATLAIRILPPWWRTRVAIALWIVLGLAAATLLRAAVRRRAGVRLALLERETLRRDSLTDPLTGLHNRRFLVGYLQHEVPRVLREYHVHGPAAAESGDDLLLMLIDVDHFKAISDQHSHGVGDRVLRDIAATLQQHIRDSDLAVRWGGDEFLIVSRSFRRNRAAEHAERLRAAVAAVGEKLAAEGGPACTLSIGFAAFPFLPREPEAFTWEQTLDLADHALRLTKARKRNSYTGLRARQRVTAAAVRAFLAGGGTLPLPDGIEVVAPE